MRYRVHPGVRVRDSGFLINLRNGDSYTLNETGKVILRALLDGRASEEVHLELAETFKVTPSRARDDVESYLAHCASLGLVYIDSSS